MNNDVINQLPTEERAKELEQQVKEGLNQLKTGHDKAIIACYKMRDTKAYSVLGFDSYYAWGEHALNLKKSRLNELALAGEVQQELLLGVDSVEVDGDISDSASETENNSVSEENITEPTKTTVRGPDLTEISTPQLIALAKAPKGERLSVLDKVVVEAKAEDKEVTTRVIMDAVKASAAPEETAAPSTEDKARMVKKQHRAGMSKVSKLTELLSGLDTQNIADAEVDSWKAYLESMKQSIKELESQLGYE